MSSILDALKKLETEKTEAAKAAKIPVGREAERELLGQSRHVRERASFRPSPLLWLAGGFLGIALIVGLSVGASFLIMQSHQRTTTVASVPQPAKPDMTPSSTPAQQPTATPASTEPEKTQPVQPESPKETVPSAPSTTNLATPEEPTKPAETPAQQSPVAGEPSSDPAKTMTISKQEPPSKNTSESKKGPKDKEKDKIVKKDSTKAESSASKTEQVPPKPVVPEPKVEPVVPKPAVPEPKAEPIIPKPITPESKVELAAPAPMEPLPQPATVSPPPIQTTDSEKPITVAKTEPKETSASKVNNVPRPMRPVATKDTDTATQTKNEEITNIFALPVLSMSDRKRLGLSTMKLNMVRPPTKTRRYGSAIINLQPVMVGEVIPDTDAVLIAVDMRGIAVQAKDSGERYHIPF